MSISQTSWQGFWICTTIPDTASNDTKSVKDSDMHIAQLQMQFVCCVCQLMMQMSAQHDAIRHQLAMEREGLSAAQPPPPSLRQLQPLAVIYSSVSCHVAWTVCWRLSCAVAKSFLLACDLSLIREPLRFVSLKVKKLDENETLIIRRGREFARPTVKYFLLQMHPGPTFHISQYCRVRNAGL